MARDTQQRIESDRINGVFQDLRLVELLCIPVNPGQSCKSCQFYGADSQLHSLLGGGIAWVFGNGIFQASTAAGSTLANAFECTYLDYIFRKSFYKFMQYVLGNVLHRGFRIDQVAAGLGELQAECTLAG